MPRDEDYLADILEAADLIKSYADGLTRAALSEDFKTRDALIRQLQIIGEAAGRSLDEFRASHPDVPWRQIIGMRDILVHQYRLTST